MFWLIRNLWNRRCLEIWKQNIAEERILHHGQAMWPGLRGWGCTVVGLRGPGWGWGGRGRMCREGCGRWSRTVRHRVGTEHPVSAAPSCKCSARSVDFASSNRLRFYFTCLKAKKQWVQRWSFTHQVGKSLDCKGMVDSALDGWAATCACLAMNFQHYVPFMLRDTLVFKIWRSLEVVPT